MMLIKDKKSVSPVVGMILMVLITVILITTIFKLTNVFFQPAPNVMLDVELYTVNKANATKVIVRDLGGDPLYFKNRRIWIYLDGQRFNFYPFTKRGRLMAGDVGILVVPYKAKVNEIVNVMLAIGGMTLVSGEYASVFYSKDIAVRKAKPIEKGLLAEWHFEGFNYTYVNSNPPNKREVYDLSGNSNDLDIAGWNNLDNAWVKGINGMAYYFGINGLDFLFSYYDGKVHVIDPGNSFTYEAWVKWTGETGWGNTIVYSGNYTYGYKVWIFVGSSGGRANLGFYIVNESGNRFGGYTGVMLEKDKWYYLALTYENGKAKLYLNGNLVYTCSVTGRLAKSDYVTGVGGAPGYSSFGGVIDEVYIWSRALTPQEIKERYYAYAGKIS